MCVFTQADLLLPVFQSSERNGGVCLLSTPHVFSLTKFMHVNQIYIFLQLVQKNVHSSSSRKETRVHYGVKLHRNPNISEVLTRILNSQCSF